MGPVSDSQGQVQKASSTQGTTRKTLPTPGCEKTMCVQCTVFFTRIVTRHALYFFKPSRNPEKEEEKSRGTH